MITGPWRVAFFGPGTKQGMTSCGGTLEKCLEAAGRWERGGRDGVTCEAVRPEDWNR